MFFSVLAEIPANAPAACPEFTAGRKEKLTLGDTSTGPGENSDMGAPVFTEAELRRALKVALEFGAAVEVCPRRGVIKLTVDRAKDAAQAGPVDERLPEEW
ncbi:hypothetical protein P1J78_21780 [Psychromarinibacter sp. C21-152]|uniref:Uncharacterized protein n=1 Tax=Psychromarinibacter sediminicola TaxID=3033385 RepID=A0AAE3TAL4_9RHOB|nr:hypothetical protein [Psychromarinibacter sediminicola]MDF0603367.1 hypothetical protein [Psychromarinibacter sediminicola]